MVCGTLFGLGLLALHTSLAIASLTCDIIRGTTAIEVHQPLALDYEIEQTEYWSTACSALRPACIISPTSAEEMSTVVRALSAAGNHDMFAIKSGGHSPNENFASIAGGPLISTRRLNEVNLDTASQTVRVGPGNRWVDVAKALDGTGFTPVGGRIGDVGVAGLLNYGGLSFLSSQYGWAMNNVVEYEVVLANGTITKASAEQNKDLFDALHGGSNNFGIVTSYLLRAYPMENEIYAGLFTFTPDKQSQILAAIRDFTENYDDHPKAAIISTTVISLELIESWIMFVFYDGPDPGETFKPFLDIGPSFNTARKQSYADYLESNNFAATRGFTYQMGTETAPIPSRDNVYVMDAFINKWRETAKQATLVAGVMPSIAYQPAPKRMARAARAAGGDLIDLDEDTDYIIFELNLSYVNLPGDWDDDRVQDTMQSIYGAFGELIDGYVANGTLPDVHRPLYAGDGNARQDIYGRFRPEKREFARRVKESVDPDMLWANRTGGWKI